MVCEAGDKPIITYRFGNGNNRIYQSQFSPIEIITKDTPANGTSNFREEGYTLRFQSTQCNGSNCNSIVRDYIVEPYENTIAVRVRNCFSNTFAIDSSLVVLNTPNKNITVLDNPKCPSSSNKRCSILVTYNNLVIFQDQGDCPCTFEVQCGKCKDGEIECKKSTYPGYCCISCAEIRGGIKAATAQLRSINNG